MNHPCPAPGEIVVYHRGELAREARYKPEVRERQRAYLQHAGYRWAMERATNVGMWQTHRPPSCILYQRKIAEGIYEYVAQGIGR